MQNFLRGWNRKMETAVIETRKVKSVKYNTRQLIDNFLVTIILKMITWHVRTSWLVT